MGHLVGIDLGTTNSVIAYTELGRQRGVKVDKNESLSAVFPSVIAVDKKGRTVFGGKALREYGLYVQEFKRGIGTDSSWQLGDETCSALELSAMLLQEMKTRFEESEGTIDGAVITVPANFTDRKRHETREAGRLAGLNVLRIINEPSAAAIAYTLSDNPPGENSLVIDWGGGTLDVSLLDADPGVLDIKANDGDEHCGGMDVDRAVYERILKDCGPAIGDGVNDRAMQSELMQYAQKVKHHLSEEEEWTEALVTRSRPLFLDFQLTRGELEEMMEPLVKRVMEAVDRCLKKAPEGALSASDISDILLVGGSCNIPMLRREVQRHFGRQGRMSLNPMEVVALGAAYQAQHATSTGELVTLHSLTHSLGVSCVGQDKDGVLRDNMFSTILQASTKLPARNVEEFLTLYDGQDEINVHVYEALVEAETVERMTEWDSHTFTIPEAPAGAYPIEVGFAYDQEENLLVEVEIKSHNYKESWRPKTLLAMEAKRPESQAKVEAFANPGLAALAEFQERVLAQFNGKGPSARLSELLNELDDAIDRSDLDGAREAKRKLGSVLYDEGIYLS